jgi:calnexin
MAIVTKSSSAHSAISTRFDKPITIVNKTIIVQYKMTAQKAFTCSGGYIKVFSDPDFRPSKLTNETQYTLMFGPDRCGSERIHFIYQHFHPIRRRFFQKALRDPPAPPIDLFSHLYTLVIRPNATFSIWVDNEEKRNGSLFFDFVPPLLEPREIADPEDRRPEGFEGEWKPKKIRNPYYFMDLQPSNFPPFTGVGFEIWAVNRELAFSNVLIAHDEEEVRRWNEVDFLARNRLEEEPDEPYVGPEEEKIPQGFWNILKKSAVEIGGSFVEAIAQPEVVGVIIVSLVLVWLLARWRTSKRKAA